MRKIIASLLIAGSSIMPLTIGQYIQRTMSHPGGSFCVRYDNGAVEQTYLKREKIAAPRLSLSQLLHRARLQLRGASFARQAAHDKKIPTCESNGFEKFSRARAA